jgi:aminopeptidase YwaD
VLAAAVLAAAVGVQAHTVAVSISRDGARPAAGALERRAHRRMKRRFERAGMTVRVQRFSTPRGRSRNVIGIREGERRCVRVLMAHADTVPPSPGAEDNASGVGTLVALAPRVAALEPACDVWLVATGAEERIYTGRADHLGASALVRRVRARGRAGDLRWALSLDEVGRGREMWLRSPARRGFERRVEVAAGGTGLRVRWVADTGSGNSDHREFGLAGLTAGKLGAPDNPARHTAADVAARLRAGTFVRVRQLLETLLGG